MAREQALWRVCRSSPRDGKRIIAHSLELVSTGHIRCGQWIRTSESEQCGKWQRDQLHGTRREWRVTSGKSQHTNEYLPTGYGVTRLRSPERVFLLQTLHRMRPRSGRNDSVTVSSKHRQVAAGQSSQRTSRTAPNAISAIAKYCIRVFPRWIIRAVSRSSAESVPSSSAQIRADSRARARHLMRVHMPCRSMATPNTTGADI
jgi:hypothetical protein